MYMNQLEFEGELQPSYVDGKTKIYFPRREKRRRLFIVGTIIFGCIAIVIGAVSINIIIMMIIISMNEIK